MALGTDLASHGSKRQRTGFELAYQQQRELGNEEDGYEGPCGEAESVGSVYNEEHDEEGDEEEEEEEYTEFNEFEHSKNDGDEEDVIDVAKEAY